MASYSIKDLEKVTGIKAHTIRIWEKRYSIVEPSRTDTNIRFYSDDDLKKLLNISLLNRNGMKISKLAQLSLEEIQGEVLRIANQPTDADTKIESLLVAMLDLNVNEFTASLKSIIDHFGFEDAFLTVVRPFLSKAGVLWMAGTIDPGQEHFVSNLIRQKLVAEIDSMQYKIKNDAKRFLLFLPEGELHELGLLFFSYQIRKMGHEFIYFGQTTPLESVIKASDIWKPQYIILSVINPMALKTLQKYLDQLQEVFESKKILINGYQTQFLEKASLGNITILEDYKQFEELLLELD